MAREVTVGSLKVSIFENRADMGRSAAEQAGEVIRGCIAQKGEANLIFASAPSQLEVYDALLEQDIDWSCVNAFHMDEYVGLDIESPTSFANYIREHLFSRLPLKNVFYLDGTAEPTVECARYAALLKQYPVDVTFAGIGENGHLAFNDPYLADFFDPRDVIVNEALDEVCQGQQVADGWYASVEDIPKSALTLTFPALLRAKLVLATVPGTSKSAIVQRSLEDPIGHAVPATILRLHLNARLLLDNDSAALLSL